MKETGIIMSGDHPKLILDGIKTMTRRVIKPQPKHNQLFHSTMKNGTIATITYYAGQPIGRENNIKCPYGQVGDRLWVRETWYPNPATCTPVYKADYPLEEKPQVWSADARWQPSIHMPRWASRITLEITEIRVERVQEISGEDAIAEGIETMERPNGRVLYSAPKCGDRPAQWEPFATYAFMWLWDSLNAKRGWEVNPWVWVISFKLMKEAKK